MKLELTYGGEVLFTKEVELDARKRARVVDRVTMVTRTTAETIAYSNKMREEYEAKLTKEQKDELARIAALKPDERRAEFLVKEKTQLENRLTAVTADIAAIDAKLNPVVVEP